MEPFMKNAELIRSHSASRQYYLAICATTFALLLAGCGESGVFPTTPSEGAAISIGGKVHGGQQPVTGATLQLYANSTSAYGASSTALIPVGTGAVGSTGYVAGGGTCVVTTLNASTCLPLPTTSSSGTFSITGDYTCTSGSQLYLLATGGNPGLAAGTNNTGIALMAGLGACPATGTLALTVPYVFIDEVTTVAAAYALSGFFTDATHLATSGSALSTTGINNAALNIAAISSVSAGAALAATPNGKGTVPQAEINLLANILASCINSNGSGCTTLFSLAKNGNTVPTETATAAINIAHNAGANVSALFALASATGPFQPALTSTPNDYSITINYTPATATFATAGKIAIDASGNVWGPGNSLTSVVELSPLGATTKSISFPTGGTGNGQYAPLRVSVSPAGTIWVGNYQLAFAQPTASAFSLVNDSGATWAVSELAVAFDTSNNAWSANNYPASLGEFSPNGVLVPASSSGYEPGGFAPPSSSVYPSQVLGVAVDSANHIWGICGMCVPPQSSLTGDAAEITNTGVAVSGSSGDHPSTILYPSGIAIDAGNNAWISDFNTGVVTKYSSTSTLLSGTGYPAGGGLGGLNSLAIDGSGNVLVAGGAGSYSGVLYELTNAGVLTSPPAGYQALSSTTFYYPNSIAIDGSGNVWALDYSGGMHVTLGLATPVVTPITASALGQRP
jgi:hypothetical protein